MCELVPLKVEGSEHSGLSYYLGSPSSAYVQSTVGNLCIWRAD